MLQSRLLAADRLHWISGALPGPAPFPGQARLRNRQTLQVCEITAFTDQTCEVRFALSQRAVTPGQAVVFYAGDCCLGGATVARVGNTLPRSGT